MVCGAVIYAAEKKQHSTATWKRRLSTSARKYRPCVTFVILCISNGILLWWSIWFFFFFTQSAAVICLLWFRGAVHGAELSFNVHIRMCSVCKIEYVKYVCVFPAHCWCTYIRMINKMITVKRIVILVILLFTIPTLPPPPVVGCGWGPVVILTQWDICMFNLSTILQMQKDETKVSKKKLY